MHELIFLGLGLALGATTAAVVLPRRRAQAAKNRPASPGAIKSVPRLAETVVLLKDAVAKALDVVQQLSRAHAPPTPQALQAAAPAKPAAPVHGLLEQAHRMQECIEQLGSFASSALTGNEQLRNTLTLVSSASSTVDARLAAVAPLFNEAALLSTAVTDHLQTLHDTSKTAFAHSGAVLGGWQDSLDLLGHFGDALGVMQACVTHVQDVANKAKLLSLNAAIVASQSQENGQGFSVVAEQIKTVALKTQEASHALQQGLDAVATFRDQFAQLSAKLGEALTTGRKDHDAVQQLALVALTTNASLRHLLEQRAQTAAQQDSAVAKMRDAATTLISGLMELNSALRLQGKDTRRAQGLATRLVADLALWAEPKDASDAALDSRLQASAALCQQWQDHHTQLVAQLKEASMVLVSAVEQAALLQAQVPQTATMALKS